MKWSYPILLVVMLFFLSACAQPIPSPGPLSSPAPTPSPTPPPEPTPTEVAGKLTITILYDNNEYDERLETAWGFSCLVEGLEKTILFDTGGDSSMLLSNMAKLAIEPGEVEVIMVSHIHQDHLGGLAGFLKENSGVTVYLPKHFPDSVKSLVRQSGAELIEVDKLPLPKYSINGSPLTKLLLSQRGNSEPQYEHFRIFIQREVRPHSAQTKSS